MIQDKRIKLQDFVASILKDAGFDNEDLQYGFIDGSNESLLWMKGGRLLIENIKLSRLKVDHLLSAITDIQNEFISSENFRREQEREDHIYKICDLYGMRTAPYDTNIVNDTLILKYNHLINTPNKYVSPLFKLSKEINAFTDYELISFISSFQSRCIVNDVVNQKNDKLDEYNNINNTGDFGNKKAIATDIYLDFPIESNNQ